MPRGRRHLNVLALHRSQPHRARWQSLGTAGAADRRTSSRTAPNRVDAAGSDAEQRTERDAASLDALGLNAADAEPYYPQRAAGAPRSMPPNRSAASGQEAEQRPEGAPPRWDTLGLAAADATD